MYAANFVGCRTSPGHRAVWASALALGSGRWSLPRHRSIDVQHRTAATDVVTRPCFGDLSATKYAFARAALCGRSGG